MKVDFMNIDSIAIDEIVAEIDGTYKGAGVDLSLSSIYDEIKNARIDEDNEVSYGVWERPLKKADWKKVAELSISSLKTDSKDLQLVAWLMEALCAQKGFAGILEGIIVLRSFLESFWNSCFPRNNKNESNDERKFRILDWIYESLAKKALFIPFVKIDDDTNINLYQYEYALEMKTLASRHQQNVVTVADMDHKNGKKTIEELKNSVSQTTKNGNSEFFFLHNAINEEIEKLVQTISKISKNLSASVFKKLIASMDKIHTLLNTHQMLDNPEKIDAKIADNNREITSSVPREELYIELSRIKGKLENLEKHSPSHYLLQLVLMWKDKELFEIITDLKTGSTEAHKLLRYLMS
jgi:type VI secretion system protein ImpA